MITLELLIPPKPLKRARHASRGKFISTYYTAKDKQEMDTLENAILNALTQSDKDYIAERLKSENLEIALLLEFGFEMPQSYSKKKRESLMGKGHTNAVDLDNLIKNVQDRGNGILWSDDKYITEITARKMWSSYNYIRLQITYSCN
jgi:Holliday junction resolvase RusA-like endonuclease